MNKDTTIKGVILADENGLIVMRIALGYSVVGKGNINPAVAGLCCAICRHGTTAAGAGKAPDNGYVLVDFAKTY